MLTESQVSEQWRALFTGRAGNVNSEILDQAEDLVQELRPESPLQHRLGRELREVRERFQPVS